MYKVVLSEEQIRAALVQAATKLAGTPEGTYRAYLVTEMKDGQLQSATITFKPRNSDNALN